MSDKGVDFIVLVGDVVLKLLLQVLHFVTEQLQPLDAGRHVVDLLVHWLQLLEGVLLLKFSALEQFLNLLLSLRNFFDAVALCDV